MCHESLKKSLNTQLVFIDLIFHSLNIQLHRNFLNVRNLKKSKYNLCAN